MNQQTPALTRLHYFYVGIAKFLFHHPMYGIVSVRDPIKLKDAARYNLSPLILYGLTVAGLPIRWMTFTSVDQPKALRDVLLDAWLNADGLRGKPDILLINRNIEKFCPNLVGEMKTIGVHVEVADAKEKSLPAALRSAQNASPWLLRKRGREKRPLTRTLQELCLDAQYDHDASIREDRRGMSSIKIHHDSQQWLGLPSQIPELIVTNVLDWKPGAWLSSWESSLPPDQPRYFNTDAINGTMWLLIGENKTENTNTDDNVEFDNSHNSTTEIVKNLVACWPNSPKEIATAVGVTLRELQWFMSGKAVLNRQAYFALQDLLSIEYNEFLCEYVGTGPYVLMAKTPMALKETYENLSGGGNACPCEIIPSQGAADPSWRYVLINNYDAPPSIVMAPRGAKISEHLPDLLMNYGEITPVSQEFYRNIVSTCARACREPTANSSEMQHFGKLYEKHWLN